MKKLMKEIEEIADRSLLMAIDAVLKNAGKDGKHIPKVVDENVGELAEHTARVAINLNRHSEEISKDATASDRKK
jgi:hypothetical protein